MDRSDNSEKGKRFRPIRLGIVVLSLLVFVVICYSVIFLKDGTSDTGSINVQASSNILLIPVSNASVEWECGTYYSDISKENMQSYLTNLSDIGWKEQGEKEFPAALTEGTVQYNLANGDHLLQLMTFYMDPEVSICNSILVYYDEEISAEKMMNREGSLTKSEAIALIQPQVDELSKNGEIPDTKDVVTGLFELYIEDAYEKLQLQAYAAISDFGFTGCFFIRKGVVSYVKGNLSNACVVDIDEDGVEELLDGYGSWSANTYWFELVAYEYINPIYFSSLTEILQQKYYNRYWPENGYEELRLVKKEDQSVKLVGDTMEYGNLEVQDNSLVVTGGKSSGFLPWSSSFDQSRLSAIEKNQPSEPPKIAITLDELPISYVTQKTNWEGETAEFTIVDVLKQIEADDQFVPTINLGNRIEETSSREITIDFGSYIPDSICVFDAMMDAHGNIRYGDKLNLEQAVQILDNSRVRFTLGQHMAYFLSSSSFDYEKDWRRLFQIKCSWGEKECTYAFLINTGSEEQLTEIVDDQFLGCEGSYSMLSSNWGLGITIDRTNLPESFYVEWQVSDGELHTWSEQGTKPIEITALHNGHPMTFSQDSNLGEVIWTPDSFENTEDIVIKAYVYETEDDRIPVAHSEIQLENVSGVFQKKRGA